jgi:hypothetical protein
MGLRPIGASCTVAPPCPPVASPMLACRLAVSVRPTNPAANPSPIVHPQARDFVSRLCGPVARVLLRVISTWQYQPWADASTSARGCHGP